MFPILSSVACRWVWLSPEEVGQGGEKGTAPHSRTSVTGVGGQAESAVKMCQKSQQTLTPCHLSAGSLWLQHLGELTPMWAVPVVAAAYMLGREFSSHESQAVAVILLSQVQSSSRDTALPLKSCLAGHGGTHLLSQHLRCRGRRIS